MEQIINRSEFDSPRESVEYFPDTERWKTLGDFDYVEHNTQVTENGQGEDEMDFCLFAPPPKSQGSIETVARIRIRTPTPQDVSGFVTGRDSSYYFADSPTQEQRANFEAVAVTGQEILARAKTYWPGSSYAWKVIHVLSNKRQRRSLSTQISAEPYSGFEATPPPKRKRPGKNARLKIRAKAVAAKGLQEQRLKEAESKATAEQDKRTRRNREKKVKRKQREKAKKVCGADRVVGEVQREGDGSWPG